MGRLALGRECVGFRDPLMVVGGKEVGRPVFFPGLHKEETLVLFWGWVGGWQKQSSAPSPEPGWLSRITDSTAAGC